MRGVISLFICLQLPLLTATGTVSTGEQQQRNLHPQIQSHIDAMKQQTLYTHMQAQSRKAQQMVQHKAYHAQTAQQLYSTHQQNMAYMAKMLQAGHAEVQPFYQHMARATTVFLCNRTGDRIHVERVNDSICDCCDGSDEVPAQGCPDRCGALERAAGELEHWAKKHGGSAATTLEVPRAGSRVGPRGMVATRRIKTGEVVLRVPKHLVLSEFSPIANVAHADRLQQLRPFMDRNGYLALVLLYHMNDAGSPWRKWIDALPTYVKSVFHSASDWSWLQQQQPSTALLLELAQGSQKYVVQAYQQIRHRLLEVDPVQFPAKSFSLVRFTHAYTLVNSRCIAVNASEARLAAGLAEDTNATGLTPVLVPWADMFNHDARARSGADAVGEGGTTTPQFRVDGKTGDFEVLAGRDYATGSEVFISYGTGVEPSPGHITNQGLGSQGHMLHHYGFMDHTGQEHQRLYLGLKYVLGYDRSACGGVTETGSLEPWRRHLLQLLGLAQLDYVTVLSNGTLDQPSLTALRVWTLCPHTATMMGVASVRALAIQDQPLDRNNEVAVQWMLLSSLDAVLLEHPSSLEQDIKTLQLVHLQKLQPDLYGFVQYTVSVKRSLHRAMLTSLRAIERVYRTATNQWLADKMRSGPHLHEANVETYAHWVDMLHQWRAQWESWSKALGGSQ